MEKGPRNILVTGPPRSGTSLATSLLVGAGYHVGDDLIPADQWNPLGYFQSEVLTALNVDLFRRVGFPHASPWIDGLPGEEEIRRIGELDVLPEHRRLLEAFETRTPWAWKDPRLCYTLGFWRKLLDFETAGVILLHRRPAAVYHSFRRRRWVVRGKLTRDEVFRRVEHQTSTARATLRRHGIPHIEVSYDELLGATARVVQRIAEFTGADVRIENVNVRPELNHASPASRLAWHAARLLHERWPALVRTLRPLVPRALVYRAFPERRFAPKGRRDDATRSARGGPAV